MSNKTTFSGIIERMLSNVASKYDKREGSVIWDALAPASLEFQNLYILIEGLLIEMFADTATINFLVKHCADRGITRKPASHAIVIGQFEPSTLEIPIGNRFSHEEYNYVVTDKIENGLYHLKCEQIGSEPNNVVGTLIPIDYINNLQSANIIGLSIAGEDDEDVESLRARYFDSLKSEAFGGNKMDYEQKIMSITGVGGVKVYSGAEWNGGGTVKCVIVDSDHELPSLDLVNTVQNTIDTETTALDVTGDIHFGEQAGSGKGVAPIGHFVTVVGANCETIDVDMTITYDGNNTWGNVKEDVFSIIDGYFKSLNEKWSKSDKIRVRISQLESKILDVEGIVDVQYTTINGKAENFVADRDSIITRGKVNGDS